MFNIQTRTILKSVPVGGAPRLPDPEVFRLVELGPAGLPSLEALLDWLESKQ